MLLVIVFFLFIVWMICTHLKKTCIWTCTRKINHPRMCCLKRRFCIRCRNLGRLVFCPRDRLLLFCGLFLLRLDFLSLIWCLWELPCCILFASILISTLSEPRWMLVDSSNRSVSSMVLESSDHTLRTWSLFLSFNHLFPTRISNSSQKTRITALLLQKN